MARRTDIARIASLSRREVEHGLPWSWTPNRLKRFFGLPFTNAYVAEVNGTFAGFSIASLGETRAHLVLLAVEPEWRKNGVGSQLLQWQLIAAQTAGLTDMTLEVRASNLLAQHFYENAGFNKVRVLYQYYCGVEDAIRLRIAPIRARNPDLLKKSPMR